MIEEIPRFELGANCAYIFRVDLLKLLFEPVLNHGEIMVRLRQQIHQPVRCLMLFNIVPHSLSRSQEKSRLCFLRFDF
jgi:hypothetical protein